MSTQQFIHRRILLPVFETGLKRRQTFHYWRELERTQWLDSGAISAMQFKALQKLIRHAYATCSYYREDWDRRSINPGWLANSEDLSRWPVIDRDAVREHRMEMRSKALGMRLLSKSTGGSSGTPLGFDLDTDSDDRRMAAWHRGYGWAGAAPGTRQLYLWGTPTGERTALARWKDRLYHALYRRNVMSCFDMDERFPADFAAAVDRSRPDAIVAYTGPLHEVSLRLESGGPSHKPRAIVVGAEKLHAFQREQIERVFGAPVFETYGSREFMLIGAECDRHSGLHLTSEHLFVEVVDEDGRPTPAGQEGNVVITDLYNYGMPFIRYANGDRAIAGFEQCACGRGLPLLKKVVGRELDIIRTGAGRMIPGEFFPHLVKDFPAVRRFQVVQEEPDWVRFAMVAEGMNTADRLRLECLVRDALGPRVRVDFESVPDIPLSPAGKLQVVINRAAQRRAA
jgi:phenylacetate-CoA ligase